MTRMNPLIIAQIISEVEKNRLLYDKTVPEYKNMAQKLFVWGEIAKKVGAKNGDYVCWKWRNLRDTYSKYRKHTPDPQNEPDTKTGQYIQWRWAPFMAFLDPFMRKPKEFFATAEDLEDRTRDLEDSEDTELQSEPVKQDNPEEQDSRNSSFSSNSSKFNPNITSKTDNNKNKRKYVEEIDEVVIDPFQQEHNTSQESSSNRLDMIDYLFLNYADTFKKLSRKRQALLKLNMAKMFATAELEELERDPIQFKIQVDDSD